MVRVVEELEVPAADLVVRQDAEKQQRSNRRQRRERHGPVVGAPSCTLRLAVRGTKESDIVIPILTFSISTHR